MKNYFKAVVPIAACALLFINLHSQIFATTEPTKPVPSFLQLPIRSTVYIVNPMQADQVGHKLTATFQKVKSTGKPLAANTYWPEEGGAITALGPDISNRQSGTTPIAIFSRRSGVARGSEYEFTESIELPGIKDPISLKQKLIGTTFGTNVLMGLQVGGEPTEWFSDYQWHQTIIPHLDELTDNVLGEYVVSYCAFHSKTPPTEAVSNEFVLDMLKTNAILFAGLGIHKLIEPTKTPKAKELEVVKDIEEFAKNAQFVNNQEKFLGEFGKLTSDQIKNLLVLELQDPMDEGVNQSSAQYNQKMDRRGSAAGVSEEVIRTVVGYVKEYKAPPEYVQKITKEAKEFNELSEDQQKLQIQHIEQENQDPRALSSLAVGALFGGMEIPETLKTRMVERNKVLDPDKKFNLQEIESVAKKVKELQLLSKEPSTAMLILNTTFLMLALASALYFSPHIYANFVYKIEYRSK